MPFNASRAAPEFACNQAGGKCNLKHERKNDNTDCEYLPYEVAKLWQLGARRRLIKESWNVDAERIE
ncbi:MAG: hypothetical protein RIQ87_1, partial [Chloroflexota bacterium]